MNLKSLIIPAIFFGALTINSCSEQSNARDTSAAKKSSETENHNLAIEIKKDLMKVNQLYTEFNNIAEASISKQRISRENISILNQTIEKINFYKTLYNFKYKLKLDKNKLNSQMRNDITFRQNLSQYIQNTTNLQQVEGIVHVNL